MALAPFTDPIAASSAAFADSITESADKTASAAVKAPIKVQLAPKLRLPEKFWAD